jgi:hypothetical protein
MKEPLKEDGPLGMAGAIDSWHNRRNDSRNGPSLIAEVKMPERSTFVDSLD